MFKTTAPTLVVLMALVGCEGEDAQPAAGDSQAQGQATFRDAETEPDGRSREPVSPEPEQDPAMTVEILVEGTGTFDVSEPECEADALTGALRGSLWGEAQVDSDGLYVATLASSESNFETPSGCPLPDVELGALTEVVVRGELAATEQNCGGWCAAHARAEAEAACEGDADEASCRAQEESEIVAGCEAACVEGDSHVIVAETVLSAMAVAELQADQLSGQSLGTVSADLEFDHVEDPGGNQVY